jgi:hypothetical protein
MHKRKPIVLLKQTNVQKEPKPLSFTKRIQVIQGGVICVAQEWNPHLGILLVW